MFRKKLREALANDQVLLAMLSVRMHAAVEGGGVKDRTAWETPASRVKHRLALSSIHH